MFTKIHHSRVIIKNNSQKVNKTKSILILILDIAQHKTFHIARTYALFPFADCPFRFKQTVIRDNVFYFRNTIDILYLSFQKPLNLLSKLLKYAKMDIDSVNLRDTLQ